MTIATLFMFLFGIIFQTLWWLKDRKNKVQCCPPDTQGDDENNVVEDNVVTLKSKDILDGQKIHVEGRENKLMTVESEDDVNCTDGYHDTADMMTKQLYDLIQKMLRKFQNLSTKKKEMLISHLKVADWMTEEHD